MVRDKGRRGVVGMPGSICDNACHNMRLWTVEEEWWCIFFPDTVDRTCEGVDHRAARRRQPTTRPRLALILFGAVTVIISWFLSLRLHQAWIGRRARESPTPSG